MYEVGQEVEWNVREHHHRGKVLAVVPPFTDPVLHVGYKNVRSYRMNFSAKLRDHTSYLILRPRTQGTNQDDLCWPRVGEIRPALPCEAGAP